MRRGKARAEAALCLQGRTETQQTPRRCQTRGFFICCRRRQYNTSFKCTFYPGNKGKAESHLKHRNKRKLGFFPGQLIHHLTLLSKRPSNLQTLAISQTVEDEKSTETGSENSRRLDGELIHGWGRHCWTSESASHPSSQLRTPSF